MIESRDLTETKSIPACTNLHGTQHLHHESEDSEYIIIVHYYHWS